MTETIPIPRELVERALILIGAWRIDTHSTKPEVWPGSPINLESQAVLEGIAAALRSALTQQAEGATQDEIIELVAALEIRAILEHIKTVAAIYPVDDMPTPFQSAWRGCCEEIFFLATGCQWHMSQDDGRRRVQGDTAGQKIVERALATSATPPSPSAEPAYTKEWCMRMAKLEQEGDADFEAGERDAQPSGEVLTEEEIDAEAELHFCTLNHLMPNQWRRFAKSIARAAIAADRAKGGEAAWQYRERSPDPDDNNEWSSWREVTPGDLEMRRKLVAARPDRRELRPLFTRPATAQDAEQAAMYRWLRDHALVKDDYGAALHFDIEPYNMTPTPEDIDREVRAAMKREGAK